MKGKRGKQYKAPRVKVTYPKGRLEEFVRPHGSTVSYNQIDGTLIG